MSLGAGVAAAVLERDGWRCRRCGTGEDRRRSGGHLVLHHVALKGMGGTRRASWRDDPVNLVTLHHDCHEHVHAHPAEARAAGLIRSRFADDGGQDDC